MGPIWRNIFEISSPSYNFGQSLSGPVSPVSRPGALLHESGRYVSPLSPTPSDQFFGPESFQARNELHVDQQKSWLEKHLVPVSLDMLDGLEIGSFSRFISPTKKNV